MPKILIIKSCFACPHYFFDSWCGACHCKKAGEEIPVAEAKDIPEWCPLEEVKDE